MDNIFGGLEKFGLNMEDMGDLFSEEKPEEKEKKEETAAAEVPKTVDDMDEAELLFQRELTCTVCDHKFKALSVRSSKLRRLPPDKDLRPRYKGVDTLKYDVYSCPYCGYTGMSRYFDHLSPLQIRLIRDGVCSKFNSSLLDVPETYDYDVALERYKLSLYNTVVKKGTISEKAYTCLKMSWLCRGKIEELLAKGASKDSETIKRCEKEELTYYAQAFEGLIKAVASESFPICGMDQNTMYILIAQMAIKLEKYDVASKLVSRILVSKTAPRAIKDRALDLKQEIITILRGTAQ